MNHRGLPSSYEYPDTIHGLSTYTIALTLNVFFFFFFSPFYTSRTMGVTRVRRIAEAPGSTGSKEDCSIVATLRDAGAIIFAKTTMTQLGDTWGGGSPAFGDSLNPWNTLRYVQHINIIATTTITITPVSLPYCTAHANPFTPHHKHIRMSITHTRVHQPTPTGPLAARPAARVRC